MRGRPAIAAFVLTLAAIRAAISPLPAADGDDPRQVVERAKAQAPTIPAQADALAALAWPAAGPGDPAVAALAREQLVGFGAQGMGALRLAVLRLDPLYTADAVSALLEARMSVTAAPPPDYVMALEDAIWVGSVDARRLAIPELARERFRPALLACIDSAYDYPELREVVIRALGSIGDQRAARYLGERLREGEAHERKLAADALATIGGRGMEVLREAVLSAAPQVRRSAVQALLPVAGIEELSLLSEYVARHGAEDPADAESARLRLIQLQSLIDQQFLLDSSSPPGD